MIGFNQINQRVYLTLLAAGTNARVIVERPNAPRPAMPYTGFRFSGGGREINDWDYLDIANDITEWFGFREITFTVFCYGDNAYDEANLLHSKLATPRVADILRSDYGISILQKTPVLDLTVLVDDAYEMRTGFEMTLNISSNSSNTNEAVSPYFDTVEPIDWTNKP